MQRSNSTIGSFQDYNPSKLWRSLTSSKETKNQTPRSSLTTNSVKPSITHKSKSKSNRDSSIITESAVDQLSKRNKRSSLIISTSRSNLRTDFSKKKHMSTIDLSSVNIHDLKVTDPKELEFYAKLLNKSNNKESSSLECQTLLEDDETSDFNSTDIASESFEAPDPLSSALEDYKLFTTRQTPLQTPTDLKHTISDNSDYHDMPSLPSFKSSNSVSSELSVFNVSNSLWIGTTINYDDDDSLSSTKVLDTFEELDTQEIFQDFGFSNTEYKDIYRTSLIFV